MTWLIYQASIQMPSQAHYSQKARSEAFLFGIQNLQDHTFLIYTEEVHMTLTFALTRERPPWSVFSF